MTNFMRFEDKLGHPAVRSLASQWLSSGSTNTPAVLEIDPTSTCNYSCPNCISADLLNRGEMPESHLSALISDAARLGAAAVIFIGGGEPLAHSAMPRPIMLARSFGLAVGITTSGYFLKRHLDAIADAASWTRVSVDAASAGTYRLVRPNPNRDSFTRVITGMMALAARKTGAMGFSFLLMSDVAGGANLGEIAAAARMAKEIGCDYFEVKPSVDRHHNLIAIPRHQRDLVADQLEEIAALADDTFEVVLARSLKASLDGEVTNQVKTYHQCPTLELRTVATPTGFYACPYKRGLTSARWASSGYLESDWSDGRHIRDSIDPAKDCAFYCIRDELNILLLSGPDLPTSATQEDDPFV